MMKAVLIFLPLLFAVAFAQNQYSSASADENQINDEKFLWHYHGFPFHGYHHHPGFPHHFFPHPHFEHGFPHRFPFPFPSQAPSSPSTPSDNNQEETNEDEKFVFPHPYIGMRPLNDDHMQCFLAVHDRNMKSCLNDFHSFLTTHRISITSDCCSALQNIQDSCPYNNHFLDNLVDQHCGAPSPSN